MNASLLIEWLTLAVAIGGVAGGLFTLRQGNRQRLLELGSFYIQRYWAIDDDLLRFPKGSEDHRHARHRYLRLCEDEFEAARRGWLDKHQWEIWHEWISRSNGILGDLDVCDPDKDSFEHVRACLDTGGEHAWANCGARMNTRSPDTATARATAAS